MKEAGEKLLEMVKKSGFGGEVFLVSQETNLINVFRGKALAQQKGKEIGFGLRVLRDGKIGFSFGNRITKAGLQEAVKDAFFLASRQPEDPANCFAKPLPLPSAEIFDPRIEQWGAEKKTDIVKNMEKAALRIDPRIQEVTECKYKDAVSEILILNTNGLDVSSKLSRAVILLEAKAQEGSQVTVWWGDDFAYSPHDLDPQKFAGEIVFGACRQLGSRTYPTKKTTLVFSPEMTAELFLTFAPAFSGRNAILGQSLFAKKEGVKIASSLITLVDDGLLKGGMRTGHFDDEGVPQQITVLIAQGVLQGFFHNLWSARKMNCLSTGNASRGGFNTLPGISPSNLYIQPGKISSEDLIGSIKEGIYITQLLGLHSVNPISGNFTLPIYSGFAIENGELAYPIKNLTIAGNLREFLQSVACVANDFRLFASGAGGSTILVENIQVGGE